MPANEVSIEVDSGLVSTTDSYRSLPRAARSFRMTSPCGSSNSSSRMEARLIMVVVPRVVPTVASILAGSLSDTLDLEPEEEANRSVVDVFERDRRRRVDVSLECRCDV